MRKASRNWLGLSLLLHLTAGLFSYGFNDMDEHFQILEFLAYRLGRGVRADLPHEFFERCRSFFQPTFYEIFARIWLFLGVDNPAVWAATFRVVTALIGWSSLVALYFWAKQWMKKPGYLLPLVLQLSALIYFLPYVHARHSGESLGGSLFFLGFASFFLLGLDKTETRSPWVRSVGSGFVLGLGFLCRFQIGFAIFGFGLWCLWRRVHFKRLSGLAFGLVLALGVGVLVDHRGYDEWVFTPWLYFKQSFLLGTANSTGVSPWWSYLRYLGYDVPYLGDLIGGAVILTWVFQPQNPLTWVTLPFFLVHSAIGHKEPRYMYPLVSALPVMTTLGYQVVREKLLRGRAFGEIFWLRPALWAVWVLNTAGLVGATLKPARSQMLLHDYVFKNRQSIHEVHVVDGDPFSAIGMQMHFYLPTDLKVVPDSFPGVLSAFSSRPEVWMTYTHQTFPPEAGVLINSCEMKYSVFPNWLKFFEFLPGIRNSANRTSIFYCHK